MASDAKYGDAKHNGTMRSDTMLKAKAVGTRMVHHRKSLASILEEAARDQGRSGAKLGLLDLLAIGIGSTLGSGVFVLSGQALSVAGPSSVVAWLAGAVICMLSSSSYMELSARLPTKGSCYVFSYHGLGEFAGVIGAVCLTMEYGISGAGIARGWSAKFAQLTGRDFTFCYNGGARAAGSGCDDTNDYYFDPVAGAMTFLCSLIVVRGLDIGKVVINAFTVAKVCLVLFMIIAGLSCWTGNMFESASTFAPAGPGGLLKATSLTFFGFIGFDEVCCMASKAENPVKIMPWALGGTLLGAAAFSGMAQLALAAMVPYSAGMAPMDFEAAFAQHRLHWAHWVVSIGELVLLPLVVLLSILPQPELTAAMAEDGLLPSIFARKNSKGNYVQGAGVCGILLTVVAMVVPFALLWNIISLGVLLSLSLTNGALINVRYGNGGDMRQRKVDRLVWLLMALMAVAGFVANRGIVMPWIDGTVDAAPTAAAIATVAVSFSAALAVLLVMRLMFTQTCDMADPSVFKAWAVPFCPGISMFFNFFLTATIPWSAWWSFAVFAVLFTLFYVAYIWVKTGHPCAAHDAYAVEESDDASEASSGWSENPETSESDSTLATGGVA